LVFLITFKEDVMPATVYDIHRIYTAVRHRDDLTAGTHKEFLRRIGLICTAANVPVRPENWGVVDPATKLPESAKSLSSVGEVRAISKKDLAIDGKFFIVDGKEMLMPLTDPKVVHDTQDIAIWSKSNYAASNLLNPIFDHLWTHGKSLK